MATFNVLAFQDATRRVLLLLGCAFSFSGAQAADDPPGRVGRVAEVQGQAWLYDTEGGEWTALQRNRPVTQGDRVTVDGGARLELRIGSTTLRLGGDSDLQFTRLDDDAVAAQLNRGSAAVNVVSDEVVHELSLATAQGRFTPRRTGHYRVDATHDTSYASAYSGELRFQAHDSSLSINPGQRAELWQDGAATHYSWSAVARDGFADWVARDSRDDLPAASAAQRYVSPEMTGWEVLDRHGRWDTHPEYGAVWAPTTVAPGWAPYRHGQWAWVRPWGWTWVDDAPWGFAPSHYGRWVHWHNRWVWAPGQRVQRPVYAPALVAWMGSPGVSVGIHVGGAPAVGWVPLAPRELYRPGYRLRADHWRHVNPWHRHEPPRGPGAVPTGPVMYTNQGVPGGISVAPGSALQARQPVRPVTLDGDQQRRLVHEPGWTRQAPPVVVAPGAAPAPRPQPAPGLGRGLLPPPMQPDPVRPAHERRPTERHQSLPSPRPAERDRGERDDRQERQERQERGERAGRGERGERGADLPPAERRRPGREQSF